MIRIFDAAYATTTGTEHHHLGTFWWVDDTNAKTGHMTRLEAHTFVANNPGQVYVREGSATVKVVAYHNNAGTKWIQTVADGTPTDNLLTLAERHKRGLPNL